MLAPSVIHEVVCPSIEQGFLCPLSAQCAGYDSLLLEVGGACFHKPVAPTEAYPKWSALDLSRLLALWEESDGIQESERSPYDFGPFVLGHVVLS